MDGYELNGSYRYKLNGNYMKVNFENSKIIILNHNNQIGFRK